MMEKRSRAKLGRPQKPAARIFSRVLGLIAILWLLPGLAAAQDDRTLLGGWSEFPPFSYQTNSRGISRWEGFDVELLQQIAARAGYVLVSEPVEWPELIEGIEIGTFDIAPHATKTETREAFAYFSIPYRSETMALVLPRRADQDGIMDIRNVGELIGHFRHSGFRLGLQPAVAVPDAVLRDFIEDPGEKPEILRLNVMQLITASLDGEIDGFLADRVLIAHYLETLGVARAFREHPLTYHTDLHLMFSKVTVPQNVVADFNNAIVEIYDNGTYQRLNTKYSFPILVELSIDNFWFNAVDIIGTVAFAVSGLLLAVRYGYDVYGALVLAALPAVGGGVVRDLITNRDELAVLASPLYAALLVGTVVCGYIAIRIVRLVRHRLFAGDGDRQFDQWIKHANGMVQICDAIGLAAFTVTGVVVALVSHATPLWFWGPVLASITAAGGGILRDITRSDPNIPFLKGELYPEVALIWGFVLSSYLMWEARFLDAGDIRLGIILTFLGALATRLLIIRYRIKSPLFSG